MFCEWDGKEPHVEVNYGGECESTNILEHFIDCGKRVLLLLDDPIELMKINYEPDGTIFFGNPKAL